MTEKVYKPPEFSPQLFILISGKRKCGKDYLTDILVNRLTEKSIDIAVMRIAAPIKHYWAVQHDLDYGKLLDTSSYKEDHRAKMVEWSSSIRKESYGYFNVEAIKMAKAEGKPVWICADIRHKKDYKWFLEFYPNQIKRVRIVADPEVREKRGWMFTPGVDDAATECDLDDVEDWDLVVHNNGESGKLEDAIDRILSWLPTS